MDTRRNCFVGFLLAPQDFELLGEIAKGAGVDRYFLAAYVVRMFLLTKFNRQVGSNLSQR